MLHVTDVIEGIIRAAVANPPRPDPHSYQRDNSADTHRRRIEELQRAKTCLEHFVKFVNCAKVKIGKPQVYKTRRGGYHSFPHRGNFVKPNVRIDDGKGTDIEVENREFVSLQRTSYRYDHNLAKNMPYTAACIPTICAKGFNVPYMAEGPELIQVNAAIKEDCGPALEEIDRTIRQEWDRVEGALEQIINDHRVKKGPKERKILQEKLSETLSKTQGLIDADPAAIHAIFKLGWDEIEVLMKYAKRNKHEVDLAELEDIVEAQALAKVKNVMKT